MHNYIQHPLAFQYVFLFVLMMQLTRIKVVENPITISYGSKSLEPHMDIPMYESYPGVNLLQCLRYCMLMSQGVCADCTPWWSVHVYM